MADASTGNEPTIVVSTPTPPPEWALLERELLRAEAEAVRVFHEKYFDERGYLLCVPRWGGNDGPDDAGENMLNWTMLYALGAPGEVLDLFKHDWDGHLRQYTEAKTVEVPLAREGMYYKEFPTMFDWFHIGEWLSPYVLLGLADPGDVSFGHRTRRYAGFYMDEDPQAKNYDPRHRIIRSMFNGSRGPLLRKATGLDWAGDPIEVEGRFKPGHGERNFEQMIAHFKDYNDVVGDHPLNLGATTLALNAYALTGEKKYRDWCLEYVDAWVERTRANGGLTPTNIGLDGTIGGEAGGKWYGGVYGWGFSVIVPQTGELAHRPSFYTRCPYGFGNALLMTGDQAYVDAWRGVIEKVNENGRRIGGELQYPRSYGDKGWYNFKPGPFDEGALEVYYWSMRHADRELVDGDEWVRFFSARSSRTKDIDYPVRALRQDLGEVRARVDGIRNDDTAPDMRMSDDMNNLNPAVTESLTKLMLGGLPTGRVGYPLHCRLRYFDPVRRRPGLPEDVAALVDHMTADEVGVNLVNVSQVRPSVVIVQGGAYAEHQISHVRTGGSTTQVNGRHFAVTLAPGAGARLSIRMRRYANQPTFALPWA
jgi:hypothetical protein